MDSMGNCPNDTARLLLKGDSSSDDSPSVEDVCSVFEDVRAADMLSLASRLPVPKKSSKSFTGKSTIRSHRYV